jgi:hypothetical protein
MASDNENKQPEKTGNPDPKHHSWIEDLADDANKADQEFPLSGAETEEDFEKAAGTDETEKHNTSFFEDLDTEFPLSGGEVER